MAQSDADAEYVPPDEAAYNMLVEKAAKSRSSDANAFELDWVRFETP